MKASGVLANITKLENIWIKFDPGPGLPPLFIFGRPSPGLKIEVIFGRPAPGLKIEVEPNISPFKTHTTFHPIEELILPPVTRRHWEFSPATLCGAWSC